MAASIHLAFVTYNRLDYTKRSLAALLADPSEQFSLTIWDNGSTDGTAEYLKREVNDPRVTELVLSQENVGQAGAMNHAWGRTDAELIGKLDNDCLVPPGWTRVLAQAHRDVPRLGAVACWHYPADEFDEAAARRAGKIQAFGSHQILRHPWVCGSAFVMKRSTFLHYGPWPAGADVGTTAYFLRMALDGYVNGWYFPLLLQEHMDDPRSPYSLVTDDESVQRMHDVTYTLRTKQIHDMKSRWARRATVLENLNRGPWQANRYVGWRKKWRSVRDRLHCASRKLLSVR